MKRVLVFGMTENPGGVESVIMNYYRNIDKEQIQFDFLCNSKIVAYESEIKELGGKIFRITARSENYRKYKDELKDFFKDNSNNYNSIWVNVCSLANIDYLKYAKKYNIQKRIIHAHNSQNMDSFLRGLLHKINKNIIKKYATDFWSCSDEASNFFYNKKIIKSSEYRIINNAINCNLYRYDENIRSKYRKEMNITDKLVFCNIGRLHFQKNQEFLIKIFQKIYSKNKNAILFLIGEGPDREKLEELIKKFKLNGSVILLGVRNDIQNLLQAADVLLFPSLFEGLPLVLIEAEASDILIYASENIKNDKVIINKNKINFISLDEDETVWAEKILNGCKNTLNRKDVTDLLRVGGFDIKTEAKKIENYIV